MLLNINLNQKRKSKGKEIEYTQLEMAEYLLPTNKRMSIEKKRDMFSVRNRMINIESNFKNRKQTRLISIVSKSIVLVLFCLVELNCTKLP